MEWWDPALTAVKAVPAGVGTLPGVAPSPERPRLASPQVHTPPSVSRAMEWWVPALTAANLTPAGVAAGAGRVEVPPVVPRPSWPWSLPPQVQTVPSRAMAMAWEAPAATAVNPTPSGMAAMAGAARWAPASSPAPSWPVVLSPQV